MVRVIINGKQYQAEEGQKLLQVALDNGIEIPISVTTRTFLLMAVAVFAWLNWLGEKSPA